jgi:hypothetical protein
MITLDGTYYFVWSTRYEHEQLKFCTEHRSITGDLIVTETPFLADTYRLTLRCSRSMLVTLRATYAKTSPVNQLLAFTDEEGTQWDPSIGTGVHWTNRLLPRPAVERNGWRDPNVWLVDLVLVARGKSAPYARYLLKEDSAYLLLESGGRIQLEL